MSPILWENKSRHSVEYFNLSATDITHVLEGWVILLLRRMPTRVHYRIECDLQWRTRAVSSEQECSRDARSLTLTVDENQVWRQDNKPISLAAGLFDVDLEITPRRICCPSGGLP